MTIDAKNNPFHEPIIDCDIHNTLPSLKTLIPYWDFDAPDMALPVGLDADLKRDILAENARALYKLD